MPRHCDNHGVGVWMCMAFVHDWRDGKPHGNHKGHGEWKLE